MHVLENMICRVQYFLSFRQTLRVLSWILPLSQKRGNFHIKRHSCWHKTYFVKKKLLQEAEAELWIGMHFWPRCWHSQDSAVLLLLLLLNASFIGRKWIVWKDIEIKVWLSPLPLKGKCWTVPLHQPLSAQAGNKMIKHKDRSLRMKCKHSSDWQRFHTVNAAFPDLKFL